MVQDQRHSLPQLVMRSQNFSLTFSLSCQKWKIYKNKVNIWAWTVARRCNKHTLSFSHRKIWLTKCDHTHEQFDYGNFIATTRPEQTDGTNSTKITRLSYDWDVSTELTRLEYIDSDDSTGTAQLTTNQFDQATSTGTYQPSQNDQNTLTEITRLNQLNSIISTGTAKLSQLDRNQANLTGKT